MAKPQFAIMRFAKYKGPEISRIEAHDERTKEKYASNPDVDTSRSHLNFHLIEPQGHYRQEAEKQIREAGCRTRSDSVRLVETLITGSPAFFKKKSEKQIREFFEHALNFLKQRQAPETFVSAVVHMDEKTPHMHVTFVPLTQDHRLSAKEIIGNRKKLTLWQDDFWKHMVGKCPELERGESASETGRDHIPPRIFKAMTRLTKQRHAIEATLESINPFNGKSKAQEISKMLDVYIPGVEQMQNELKKYDAAFAEEEALKKENETLKAKVEEKKRKGLEEQLREAKLEHDYREAMELLHRIPKKSWMNTGKRKSIFGRRRSMKHFDHPSDQAAFERWVDVTAELLQKYGPAFLKQMEEMRKTQYAEYDYSAKVLRFEQPADYSLERSKKVA